MTVPDQHRTGRLTRNAGQVAPVGLTVSPTKDTAIPELANANTSKLTSPSAEVFGVRSAPAGMLNDHAPALLVVVCDSGVRSMLWPLDIAAIDSFDGSAYSTTAVPDSGAPWTLTSVPEATTVPPMRSADLGMLAGTTLCAHAPAFADGMTSNPAAADVIASSARDVLRRRPMLITPSKGMP